MVTQGSARNGSPGDLLASLCLEAGAEAAMIDARVGRSAANFWGREDTKALLARDTEFRPTLVLVMLGTNDIGLNMKTDGVAMARIRDSFPGVQVIGIGPPSFPKVPRLENNSEAVVTMMKGVFSQFIDARPLTAGTRAGDGIHFVSSGSLPFAKNILGAIQGHQGPIGGGGGGGAGAIVAICLAVGFCFYRLSR